MSDDFYVVLPSNACADTQPDNHASKYIVDWNNPIILDNPSKWKVALTEMTFNHVAKTIDYQHGFECMIKGPLSHTAKKP